MIRSLLHKFGASTIPGCLFALVTFRVYGPLPWAQWTSIYKPWTLNIG